MTTAFKVGDKVRYKKLPAYGEWAGLEGTVEETDEYSVRVRVSKESASPEYTAKVGALARLTPGNLELIPTPQEFKVGDRVTVDQSFEPGGGTVYATRKGTVSRMYGGGTTISVSFDNDGGLSTGTFAKKYLVSLDEPKPFTYKDIQKGDTIRRTKVYKSGAKEVREGVATTKGTYYWAQDNFILGYNEDHESGDVAYELLHRPEPKPKITDGTKVGDQIVVFLGKVQKVYTKNTDKTWTTLIIQDGSNHRGFVWDDTEVARNASKPGAKATLYKA